MQNIRVEYYSTSQGKVPVLEFIDALDRRTQTKFFAKLKLLETFGRKLPMPHAKYVGDHIFEFRLSGVEGEVRVMYFFYDGDKAVLTNGFVKKTNKLPGNEKEIAVQRRSEYFERHKR